MKIEQMIEQHKQMWVAFEKLNQKIEENNDFVKPKWVDIIREKMSEKPYEPKEGEYFVEINREGKSLIGIFKNREKQDTISTYSFLGFEKRLCVNSTCFIYPDYALRPATPKEKQLLDDKLKEQGKMWNAEKRQIEDIPTWKVGDWFIPHKPKENKAPTWVPDMDEYDGKACEIKSIDKDGYLRTSSMWAFHPDWCEKTEEPKKEPKIGDMCIFWDDDKRDALIRLFDMKTPYEYIDSTGIDWGNCIPFESVEQYKKFINEEC